MNDYEKIKTKLDEHFLLKRNKYHARYKFLSMKPTASETTLAYAARLRGKANECEFGENCDERILEHIIQTIENRTLIQKAITKKRNLDRFLEEAGQLEDTRLMVHERICTSGNSQSHKTNPKTDLQPT
jgi:predicted ATP-binding protein involved in virulence